MQRDGKCVILRLRVRGSVRAVRAVRNTRVFLTETRVVADEAQEIHKGDGATVIEVDLRLDLRLFHFSFGHADFLVSLWMAILRLR